MRFPPFYFASHRGVSFVYRTSVPMHWLTCKVHGSFDLWRMAVATRVKTVKGDTETTSTYDGDKIVEHECKLNWSKRTVTVVKWGETTVTVGPQKGAKKPAGSCITKSTGTNGIQPTGFAVTKRIHLPCNCSRRLDRGEALASG